jgi:stage III sporulation protein AH
MKYRKQSVWLVSMVSLMVVLSGYYLFTDDMDTAKMAKHTKTPVIKKTSSVPTTVDDYFANAQMTRDEQQEATFDKLMSQLDKADEATSATTMKTLETMQNQAEKVDALEEQLATDYHNAVITEKAGKWNVAVQANALDKTDAVAILEQVTAELQVQPTQVTIQAVRD